MGNDMNQGLSSKRREVKCPPANPAPRLVRIVVGVGVFPLNRMAMDRLYILLIQGAKMIPTIKEHHVKFRPLWHFEIE